MVWWQAVKAKPCFTQRNEMGPFLSVAPRHQSGIWYRLSRLADGIRVEHEIHKRNASTLTISSGILGISQSVVPRTESSQALNFFMR